MVKEKKTYSPFSTCEKGHDLTDEGAYTYDNSGKRYCRECSIKKKPGSARRGRFM